MLGWAVVECALVRHDAGHRIAYIGPGAGIAVVGSALAVLTAILSAFVVLVTWPVRRAWRAMRARQALGAARVKRVVVLGLDGLDPDLAEKFMGQGDLPHLSELRAQGGFERLGTTWPPLSPVAWSSFTTGTNPGKHNIFDFITRRPEGYGPAISSVRIERPRRHLPVGPYRIPLGRPRIDGRRRSRPFWSVLGDAGIFSAVIRVPITFPPDRFHGVQLSAMCVPDLLGSQGTFTFFSDQPVAGAMPEGLESEGASTSGHFVIVERRKGRVSGAVPGPPNPVRADGRPLQAPFTVTQGRAGATLEIGGASVALPLDAFTDWISVVYAAAPGFRLRGICRFRLRRFDDQRFEMYCTPVQIDPLRPVMPISHPVVFGHYLARRQGSFATLGLAEDTGALNEDRLSDEAFLDQAHSIDDERQSMFFDALRRVRRGFVGCVFDAPDRIQHMYWRFTEDDHPALRGRPNTHPDAIRDLYRRMDDLVGRTMKAIGRDTALLVMSDHGFKSFRRGVDLNAWLQREGYLVLKDEGGTKEVASIGDIDWSHTKAYALGLAGIQVNLRGREPQGIVETGAERDALVAELAQKLTGLKDDEAGQVAVHEAVAREQVYRGPYVEAAPDLVVGCHVGYRVSWDAAVGRTGRRVFIDNARAWSGDHCVHPNLVPGVLVTNQKCIGGPARIVDVAATILELLGVRRPDYMDGRSLVREEG